MLFWGSFFATFWHQLNWLTTFEPSQNLFCWNIPKIHNLSSSASNKLSTVRWISTKFSMEMSDVCGHLSGDLKFLNNFLPQSRGSRTQKKKKKRLKMPFSGSFLILMNLHSSPITTKTARGGTLCYLRKYTYQLLI